MRKFAEALFAMVVVAALATLLPSGTARAQAINATSYVASNGTDANNNSCARATPCSSFPKAISVTLSGGTVRCVDQIGQNGIFPTVTITQSIIIDCKGIGGSVDRTGLSTTVETGFIINGANIDVTLRGINLNGVEGFSGPGRVGIEIQQAASVQIEDCTIRGFSNGAAQGIRLATSSGATNLTVIDTIIAKNGLGIRVLPSGGAALVTLLGVRMFDNSSAGFEATSAAGGAVFANIVESTANGNGTNGFTALSFAGGRPVVLDIQRTTASLNAQGGIVADGPGSKITIGASTVTANGTGFGVTNGGAILSYGNNSVDNNSVDGAASGSVSTK